MKVGGVGIDAEGTGLEELVGAVAAAQEADREHRGAAGGEDIPHRVAHHPAVGGLEAQRPGAGEKEIRGRLGPRDDRRDR